MTATTIPSLEQQITAFLAEAAKTAPPGALATVGAEIGKLIASGAGTKIPAIGARAPTFALPNAGGGSSQLSTLLERGPVVLVA